MSGIALSVLDSAPVFAGAAAAQSIRDVITLAQATEEWGYRRYWLTEHHAVRRIASSSPAVLAAIVAGATSTIRVGSGGVMLRNHAPLVVSEQFSTMAAVFAGRIDLGIGSGSGVESGTVAAAMHPHGVPFGESADRLIHYLSRGEASGVLSVPSVPVDVWILGTSTRSARFAAERGLPFAFAHHLRPADSAEVLGTYFDEFKPSTSYAEPYALLSVMVTCAESVDAAYQLAAFQSEADRLGRAELLEEWPTFTAPHVSTAARNELDQTGQLIGTADSVATRLTDLASATGAHELMLTSLIHPLPDRLCSYRLLADRLLPAKS